MVLVWSLEVDAADGFVAVTSFMGLDYGIGISLLPIAIGVFDLGIHGIFMFMNRLTYLIHWVPFSLLLTGSIG